MAFPGSNLFFIFFVSNSNVLAKYEVNYLCNGLEMYVALQNKYCHLKGLC